MDFDFTPFFRRYEAISAMADQLFEKVGKAHPECVKCEVKCADCCHALFDLTLIEALYINHRFNRKFQGAERERRIEKANRSDRRVYKIKKKAYQEVAAGVPEEEVLRRLAEVRERCSMLNDAELCDIYAFRPITCRLYGIPLAIAGKAHTCGKSGFVQSESYQTVNLDDIQKMLFDLSQELVTALKSRHVKMADVLVPLSMALLNEYDAEYLGVEEASSGEGAKNESKGGEADG